MLSVNPYIAFPGTCRQATEFYQAALGAEVVFLQTYGGSPMAGMGEADQIMHATIRVGESTIMMCDDPRPDAGAAGGGNISLAIGLNDVVRAREIFTHLSGDGGVVKMPLEKTFWAEAFGIVTDRFGVSWMVNCEAPPSP